ncbi:MAG TPA: dTDP-4-dehydrorhamnose reductase [Chthonomonadaceae bacterium]|nr:dTDP-4-dehydrorhamnose reductase [Chthonomonadaceae bacterium]
MRVVVTGANGMLGLDLCALLEKAGHQVVRTDVGVKEGMEVPPWDTLDITDTQATRQFVAKHRPDAVIHGAAYTDVDGCTRNPDLAYRVNAFGTWNLAAACGEQNTTLFYISTDFVFDGHKGEPYTEFDTPHPLSYYGASKLAGEKLVAELCRKHFICRTSWLFGVNGKSFPNTMLELAKTHTERFVVVDQVGSPTSTLDLSRTLVSLLGSPLYGTYHITNSGHCSWFEFAKKTLELAGVHTMEVKPVPSTQYPSPTKRPAYSVLRHYALELQGRDDLPPWEAALAEYIHLRGNR